MDPTWGHITIKMAGHPPFDAQVMLNGHEHVAATMLDCVHIGFLPDGILDELPTPSKIGALRVGGVDVNKPRMRNALAGVLALAVAPGGFTVSEFTAKVHAMTGQRKDDYSIRQAAYDLRKLRAKHLVEKPGRSRGYLVPADAARTIAGLSVLRDQVLVPILAGLRRSCLGDRPSTWTRIDDHYETLCSDMQNLLEDLGLTTEGRMAA